MSLWWQPLVGVPYAFPSNPPESFDCWTLVKHVRFILRKRCPLPFDDQEIWCRPEGMAAAVARAAGSWSRLEAPSEGAMAVLCPEHVGVVLSEGVLHALNSRSSVIWTTFPVVRRTWPRAEWWDA